MAHQGRQTADEALAIAIATGQTIRAAAVTAGVGERTATRRWSDLAFRRRVSELRGEMVSQALGKTVDGMTEAAEVLRGLLQAESEAIRLRAAVELLQLGVKLRDATELEERLASLELQAEERKKV